ncbi:hypothetical protein EI534_11250 [Pseudomonas frederiksbergensis]|nr:hypothetical protein [Pseudomonas frederiksbergensis]
MGASLLAMATLQSTNMLNVMASSRAGSLPQDFAVVRSCKSRSPPGSAAHPVESVPHWWPRSNTRDR